MRNNTELSNVAQRLMIISTHDLDEILKRKPNWNRDELMQEVEVLVKKRLTPNPSSETIINVTDSIQKTTRDRVAQGVMATFAMESMKIGKENEFISIDEL